MRWLAFNAVRTVESLRPEEHDPTSLSDLKAQAWLQLANAYKINNQLAEAESALDRARAALRRGGNDLRLLGWAVKVESALRNAQRRLAEACELMDGAYRLYLKLEDRHLAGLALISKAVYLGHGTQYAESLLLYRRGIPLLEPGRDPQLDAIAQQGLITSLIGGGRHAEAGRLFLRSDLRHQLSNVPNIRWMEGRLLAGLGKNSKAEKALMEVREVFLGQGQEYTAAVVGLDLLPIWSLQGRSGMVRAAAGEIFDTLQSLGIRKEAAKARAYLR
jgi:tetratricopeptide (TPR) repeat protein